MAGSYALEITRDMAASMYVTYQETWGLMVAAPLLKRYTGKAGGKVSDIPDDMLLAFMDALRREPVKIRAIGIQGLHSQSL